MDDAPGRSLLTRPKILEHREQGNIVIEPFSPVDLKTTSYDVRLGLWYYREHLARGTRAVFNPFSELNVRRHWGEPQRAVSASEWMKENGALENVPPEARLIVLAPGETILAHTQEFIGGKHCVSTEMRARSSMGRIGITVCKCAGWGDLGYINRWTMEVTNHLRELSVPLIVGMRLAQIIFYQVDPIPGSSYAAERGKYQMSDDLEQVKKQWKPEAMLPKLWLDRELKDGFPTGVE